MLKGFRISQDSSKYLICEDSHLFILDYLHKRYTILAVNLEIYLKGLEMEKYACINCGYIYDPDEGDIMEDIDPGTSFEDLPDSWLCPDCGVGKDEFEII